MVVQDLCYKTLMQMMRILRLNCLPPCQN